MKNAFFFATLLALLAVSCKQDPKSANSAESETPYANVKQLAGHWIPIDFCGRASDYGSVLSAMNNGVLPYAYSMTFDPAYPDSVTCYNGTEIWKLAVVYKVDTLELKEARPGKSVYLVYDSQVNQGITMFDGTQGSTQMSNFIKSKAGTKDGFLAFQVALNHNLFSGVFSLPGKGTDNIQFTPGGFITGWPEYDRYEVCTAGDCFIMGDKMDIITLSNSKKENSKKIYGFQYDVQLTTLNIYNLIAPKVAGEGAYTQGNVAFKLARKKAE